VATEVATPPIFQAGDPVADAIDRESRNRFGDGHLVPDDRGSCKDPHQTAAGL